MGIHIQLDTAFRPGLPVLPAGGFIDTLKYVGTPTLTDNNRPWQYGSWSGSPGPTAEVLASSRLLRPGTDSAGQGLYFVDLGSTAGRIEALIATPTADGKLRLVCGAFQDTNASGNTGTGWNVMMLEISTRGVGGTRFRFVGRYNGAEVTESYSTTDTEAAGKVVRVDRDKDNNCQVFLDGTLVHTMSEIHKASFPAATVLNRMTGYGFYTAGSGGESWRIGEMRAMAL